MKDTVEKLLCNFRKPQNPDLAVELPQGVSPDLCVGSGRGRGWRGTHCPSNLCQKSPGWGSPMHLGWTWGPQGHPVSWGVPPALGGPSELSSLLTAKGNVSLLFFSRFNGKGTSVQKGICPGPGLCDSGINSESVSFKESLPMIIPSPGLDMSLCELPSACPGSQQGSCPSAAAWALQQLLGAQQGKKNQPDTEINLQINMDIAMEQRPPPPALPSAFLAPAVFITPGNVHV